MSRPDVRPVLGFFVGFWLFMVGYMLASQYLLSEQISEVRKTLVAEFQKLDPDLGRKAQRAVLDVKRTEEIFATDVKRRLARLSSTDASRAKVEFLLDLSEMLPAKTQIKSLQVDNQGTQQKLVSMVSLQGVADKDFGRLKEGLDAEFKERGYSGFDLAKVNDSAIRITARWGGATRGTAD